MTTRRVVVTGFGCASPFGDAPALWDALRVGRSAIDVITSFDASSYRSRVGGEIRGFEPTRYLPEREARASSRCLQLAVAAAEEAWAHAALDLEGLDTARVGVFMGTSIGPIGLAFEQYGTFLEKGIGRVHPMAPAQNYPGVLSSMIAIRHGIRGPVMTVTTACTSGVDALGLGLMHLRAGMIDVAIVGASEAPLLPVIYASFDRLGLLSTWAGDPRAACRPFSRDRDGIVLAEAAGVCVLETETHARKRDAVMHAEVAGFAATCDAFHPLQQLPSGDEAARAMRLALIDAGASVGDVDYVSAHGTGTVSNDVIETRAIKAVFGERAHEVPVSAIKSMTGHSMGACGILEVIAAACTMRDGIIPPTANLTEPDPECDLDYVPVEARRATVRTILSNTFGFGARNASVVLRAMV